MLLFACSLIHSGYVYDAVGVDIKGNLDLRNASSGRKDAVQTELAQSLIVSCKLSLTLYNVDINGSLVIGCCGEDLALLGGDRGVSLDQLCGNAAHGLDAQGQGVTSSSSRPFTSPVNTPPWSAAPMATHSSGLMPLKPSLPVSFFTISCTAGIRLEPPTISTLEMSLEDRPASLMACFTGPLVGLHQVGR